jgi:hypothetical protein
MHADYHGAATTIIKNSYPGKPIPLMALEEVINRIIVIGSMWSSM